MNCIMCGKPFIGRAKTVKTCSAQCRHEREAARSRRRNERYVHKPKTCPVCLVMVRDNKSGPFRFCSESCRMESKRIALRKWRTANLNHRKEYKRKYYEQNRDRVNAYKRQRYRLYDKETSRRWRQANREKIRAYIRDKERDRESRLARYWANPDKYREKQRTYGAKARIHINERQRDYRQRTLRVARERERLKYHRDMVALKIVRNLTGLHLPVSRFRHTAINILREIEK